MSYVAAGLFSLALFTPSTGFILDSLKSSSLKQPTQLWIRLQAISAEIVALALMFFLMRSGSPLEFATSSTILLLLIFVIPLVFRGFAKFITPHAQNSEFAFLVMFAIIAGLITKKLGAYYLVGAFIVGIGARRFESILPSIASENVVTSLRNFSTFFMPFYFFNAGIGLSSELISLDSLLLGIALTLVIGGIRMLIICRHRQVSLNESFSESFPISVTLLPNLVFGLVLASFMETDLTAPKWIIGGLVSYTILITAIPPFLFFLKRCWTKKETAIRARRQRSTV